MKTASNGHYGFAALLCAALFCICSTPASAQDATEPAAAPAAEEYVPSKDAVYHYENFEVRLPQISYGVWDIKGKKWIHKPINPATSPDEWDIYACGPNLSAGYEGFIYTCQRIYHKKTKSYEYGQSWVSLRDGQMRWILPPDAKYDGTSFAAGSPIPFFFMRKGEAGSQAASWDVYKEDGTCILKGIYKYTYMVQTMDCVIFSIQLASGRWMVFDQNGRRLFTSYQEARQMDKSPDYLVFKNGKCGLMNKDEEVILECKYDSIEYFEPDMEVLKANKIRLNSLARPLCRAYLDGVPTVFDHKGRPVPVFNN